MDENLKKSDITEYHLDLIARSAGLGLTQEEIAHLIGANFETFRAWLKKDVIIRSVYEKGKANARLKVAQKLMDKIDDGDTACILFYLKCQCGWKENKDLKVTSLSPVIYLPERETQGSDVKNEKDP